MARVSAWTLGSYIWGDKTLQALEFADDANAHVNPQAQDIDINSLIADYLSKTDTIAQTLQSVLGLGASPSSGQVLLVQDTALGNPIPVTNPTLLFLGNATANKLGAASSTYIYLGATGALDVNGQTNPNIIGLNFVPVVTNSGAAVTMGNFTGLRVFPKTSGFAPNTITQLAGVEIQLVHLSGNPTVTVAYGIKLNSMGKSTYATIYGIDIGALTGTTKIGIREQSTGVNLFSGKTRIGDQSTPTEFLEVAGNVLATLNLKQNTSPGAPSTIGLANSAGSSLLVPALDHIHGALPGTVVLINADETQASGTVPNTDTNVKTYSLGTNTYSNIIVEAEGYGSFVVTSTNQIVSIKIKDGATQKGQTMTIDAALGATSRIPFMIKASFAEQTAQTLSVTISAPAADANTTIFLNSLRVYGVV